MRQLCELAVDAAVGAGAQYADARIVVRRAQLVATKNGQVEEISDLESEGIGVRVLVDGAWGFACDRRASDGGAREAALRATRFAKAAPGRHRRSLAPVEATSAEYRTPLERDPFSVSIADKVDLCLRAEEGMKHADVNVRSAFVRAHREHKLFVSSLGSAIEQEIVEAGGGIEAIATSDALFQVRSYPSAHGGSSSQAGWEYVEGLDFVGAAPRVGEQASALLRADDCPAGTTTVVLDSDQMMLQVHESIGHPTELDRVYGTEAAYAGTSFLKADDLGALRYGSELMNVTADSTTPGGHGTGGSMRADGWSLMPLVRMTNLHLEPGDGGSLDELIADVDDGVYLETNKSWSIDDKRLNFQFGTQIGWEIKGGRLGRMLRDATYTGVTPVFWGGLDAVGGREHWQLKGLTNCGKGQPGQDGHVSHGSSPARFRNVQIGVKA